MLAQINSFVARRKDTLYTFAILILVAVLAFGLGRLSVHYAETGQFEVVYPEGKTVD